MAFHFARDRVAGQRASVDELRSRASGLLGAAAIATSFLAGFALDNRTESLTPFSWVGFISAGATAVLLLLVLWPLPDWSFGHKPEVVVEAYYKGKFEGSKGPLSAEQTHIALANDMASWIEKNTKKLNRTFIWFRYSVLAVGVMVVSWILDLLIINL